MDSAKQGSTELSSPFSSRVTGTGSAFPAKRVTNNDLSHTLETNDEWISERTGIRERRVSEPGKETEQNSSLAYQAAVRALEMAGKKATDVQAIFYATCTPDTLIPSSSCWLQKKIGATNAWAIDLNAACSGFVYALTVADQFVRSGQVSTALVVGSEVLSAFTNWEDRTSAILFGDGAGAFVLERTDLGSSRRIYSSHLKSDGNLWDLFHIPAGGSNMPVTPEAHTQHLNKMHMKGKEIFKVAVKTLADYAVEALEHNGFKIQDLDWFVPHQANLRIIEAVAKRLDYPISKTLVNIHNYGNTSAATTPTAFDEAVRDGRVKPGQLVLFDVFGAGLTYASLLMRW